VIVEDDQSLPRSDRPVALLANYTAFSDWMARSTP